MIYEICVYFKDDRIIQFTANKYHDDGNVYTFLSDTSVKIVSHDVVKYITIDKMLV